MTGSDLVAAFTLPGSDADGRFRAALEGREPLRTDRRSLVEFARALETELGWERWAVEEAVSQILRVGSVAA